MTDLALGKWRVTVDLEVVERVGDEPGPHLAAAVRERLETIFGVTRVGRVSVLKVNARSRQGYSGNAGPYDACACTVQRENDE